MRSPGGNRELRLREAGVSSTCDQFGQCDSCEVKIIRAK